MQYTMTEEEDERGEQWGGGHGLGPSVSLFSWGPGDSIIVSAASTDRPRPAHEPLGRGDVVPLMPTGGIDGTGCTLLEYRMHNPWGLWRHQRYVQRPFQLFFAEAHNVWSERIRETIEIGMDRSEDPVKKGNEEPLKKQQRRRDLLSGETLQYKELYGTLMARVFEYPDTELHDERENWRQLGKLLYRGHQAWHLAHIIITHLSRPNPAHQQAHRDLPFDLPFDLVHWLQEHTPADVFNAATSQPFLGNEPNETWWRSMCNFVMHFYIDQAVSMLDQLKGDGKCGQDGYTMVDQIKMLLLELKDMEDRVDQNKDIRQSWRQWKKRQEWMTIDRLIRSNKSPICAHVDVLMRILMGQEDAIAKHAQTWLQNVAARMMFGRTEAVLGVADLASLTEDALNIDTPEPDEAVLVHLMRLDMQAAVQHFFTTLQDWWSAAHLADVLYRGDYLPFSLQFAADMRSFGIRNYMHILLASNNMWQVAISYCKGLLDCDVPVHSSSSSSERARRQQRRDEVLHYAHHIVSRQPVTSDRACRRLLHASPENLTSLRTGSPVLLFDDAEIQRAGGEVYEGVRDLSSNRIRCAWGLALVNKRLAGAGLYWLSQAASPLVPHLAQRSLLSLFKDDSSSDGGDPAAYDDEAGKEVESLLEYVASSVSPQAPLLLDYVNLSAADEVREVLLMRCYVRLEHLLKQLLAPRPAASMGGAAQAELWAAGKEAAELMRRLLQPPLESSKTAAPRCFRRKLLLHAVALIEVVPEGRELFSSSDMFLFIQALQDMQLSYRSNVETKESASDIEMVRLALARGLAAAFACRETY